MTAATLPPNPQLPSATSAPSASPSRLALRRFLKNKPALGGLLFLAALTLLCFSTLPWTLNAYNNQLLLAHVKEPPSAAFPLGTDSLSRDLAARFLLGGAISLSIGIASALIAIFIGASVGLLAGYAGGRTDALLMRIVDVMYGLPYILLVILMRVVFVSPLKTLLAHPDTHNQPQWLDAATASNWANVLVLLIGIGAVSWLTMARVVRGQVLSLRDQPFVEAARALGLPPHRILSKHILPNLLGTIIVYGTLTVPNAILAESFLSFLGLGIQQPLPSWGNLASDGIDALNPVYTRWWLITWPCLGLSLSLLALNFLGDGIRDALDPRRS
jgi:ABC-type dipeptide/oligopeptide/nickel transport system permease subunit